MIASHCPLFLSILEVNLIEIKINKEVRDYQESIFFGLSLRQLLFSLLAVGIAVGLYYGTSQFYRHQRTGLDVHRGGVSIRHGGLLPLQWHDI